MKKILLLLLAWCISAEVLSQDIKALRTSSIKFRGIISSDTENVNREIEPPFAGRLIQRRGQFGENQSGNLVSILSLPNGLAIMKESTDKLIENEYKFTVLSGHKYMVNSCFGIKVSSGEFYVKFKNPHVEVNTMGDVKIKLEVDKLRFSAIKIRVKPRSPDLQDPNPCHFSGKFEISCEVKDLTVTTFINPVISSTLGAGGSTVFCLLGYEDAPKVDWIINMANFVGFTNSLDHVAKEMFYDGLDFGMQNLIVDKYVELTKSIMEKYFETCSKINYAVTVLIRNSSADGKTIYEFAGNESKPSSEGKRVSSDSADKTASKENEAEKWVITPVSTMKGVLGRLDINFPADVERNILIYQQADNKFLRSVSRNDKIYTIAPGQYRFTLTNVPVDNVPIKKGHETRLKAGFLNIVSEGNWHLYDETKEKAYTSGNKPKKLPLPIGSYQIKLGGQFFSLVIKDGETVEM